MTQQSEIERLWLATKHGDEDHQAWLHDAYTAFFAGQPVPAPRGRGNKEARIAELEAQVAAYEVMARSDGKDAEWLRMRILAALGGLRDDMPPEDVAAVQRFVDRLQHKGTAP